MTTVESKLEQLKENHVARGYLLDCLLLWNHAKRAGYEFEDIKAFSFRSRFLTKEERALDHKRPPNLQFDGDDFHNCVRLHTGELKQIPLFKRPKE